VVIASSKEFDTTISSAEAAIKAHEKNNASRKDEKFVQTTEVLKGKLKELQAQRRVIIGSILRNVARVEEKKIKSNEAKINIKREIFRLKARLPALAKREEVESLIADQQFLIIKGHTGSGKSTQLPQYLSDMPMFRGKKIICTQPRKLAAVSLAERVAFEYAAGVTKFATLGKDVGYRVGSLRKASYRTRIEYMTESTFLQLLNNNHNPKEEKEQEGQRKFKHFLEGCGAVIVDEAHERNISTDVLIGVLKEAVRRWPHLKVLVTSATLDTSLFANYLGGCPIIEIPGRTFPVDVLYRPLPPGEEDVLEAVMRHSLDIAKSHEQGDVLCFLTGQNEVERAKQSSQTVIERDKRLRGKVEVFCLYGKQTPEEQKEVFKKLPPGIRKIIFATDVAETSITIDGVRFVVDSGVTKDAIFDSKRNITTLKEVQVSKSSAEQRKGRAGRTSAGVCYRLYSEDDFQAMRESAVPELHRRPLSMTVASLMGMKIDPTKFDWID